MRVYVAYFTYKAGDYTEVAGVFTTADAAESALRKRISGMNTPRTDLHDSREWQYNLDDNKQFFDLQTDDEDNEVSYVNVGAFLLNSEKRLLDLYPIQITQD